MLETPPLQNTTVSHISPLLNYIPRIIWFEGTPNDTNLVSSLRSLRLLAPQL